MWNAWTKPLNFLEMVVLMPVSLMTERKEKKIIHPEKVISHGPAWSFTTYWFNTYFLSNYLNVTGIRKKEKNGKTLTLIKIINKMWSTSYLSLHQGDRNAKRYNRQNMRTRSKWWQVAINTYKLWNKVNLKLPGKQTFFFKRSHNRIILWKGLFLCHPFSSLHIVWERT